MKKGDIVYYKDRKYIFLMFCEGDEKYPDSCILRDPEIRPPLDIMDATGEVIIEIDYLKKLLRLAKDNLICDDGRPGLEYPVEVVYLKQYIERALK